MGQRSPGPRLRTFVALPVPEPLRALLAPHLADCERLAPAWRWVPASNLHLTLRFLGGVEPGLLEAVRTRLAEVRSPRFELSLDGRGTFGGRRSPRVVWMGVAGEVAACRALAREVESACRAAGLPADERAFRAHVTLARARGEPGPLPELPAPPALRPWTATELTLYESRQHGRQGPEYVPLATWPLRDR